FANRDGVIGSHREVEGLHLTAGCLHRRLGLLEPGRTLLDLLYTLLSELEQRDVRGHRHSSSPQSERRVSAFPTGSIPHRSSPSAVRPRWTHPSATQRLHGAHLERTAVEYAIYRGARAGRGLACCGKGTVWHAPVAALMPHGSSGSRQPCGGTF